MNDKTRSTLLDAHFDRLVDGELSASEYQKLLKQLDERPALWRHCALAFLEAQAWRNEMSAIRRGQEMAAASPPMVPAAALPMRRWLQLLAIAASFVLAFVAGLAVQREWDERSYIMAASKPGASPEGQGVHEQTPGQKDFQPGGKEPDALGNIRLVVDGGQGNQPQQIDVPVYDLDEMGAAWLTQDRPFLPEDVIQSLNRRGRKVERQIEYLPLPLDDEHQIVVPVEQIQITPISRRSY